MQEWRLGKQDQGGNLFTSFGGQRNGEALYMNILMGAAEAAEKTNKDKVSGRTGYKSSDFLSTVNERSWLTGALTGKLKDDFLWKFHGEDIQNEL